MISPNPTESRSPNHSKPFQTIPKRSKATRGPGSRGTGRFPLQELRGFQDRAQLLRREQRAQRAAALLQLGRGDTGSRAGRQDALESELLWIGLI